ncbi:unnamed protein product [Phytophthora fragariaefolia]|uniref:Unnamed protein product n=1 Tax=Phytophthora fragariaefolia TaxID=1490495 RepID=A0A9W6XI33_9STRA|nr:unnamed protein product [Phytophthora fragariaefolia]
MESQNDNLGGAVPGDGGSESENLGRLRRAASGGGSKNVGRLREAASGGGGSEGENLGHLREAAVAASGSARSDGNTRSADENATGAAQRVIEVVPAMENAEGGSASAPKRKRGRPKSSNLVRALGQAHDNVAPSTQSNLASTESVSLPGETLGIGAPVTDTADSEASVPSARTGTVQQTGSPATPSAATRRNSLARPPLIPGLYVDTLVAFSPEKEGWTKRKKTKDKYVGVGSAYLVGRVCRIIKGAMFQVQWLDSQYQRKDEHLNLSMIQRGKANYRSLHGSTSRVGWSHLCAVEEGEQIEVEGSIDDMEECVELFDPPMELPTTLAEVEAIKNMRFDPEAQSKEPEDLFQHPDGSTATYLLPQFKHLFDHSASASFFAYIPLVDKGEYSNYWGEQVETAIFGGNSVSLDAVMPIRRFKQLRQSFCFQCVEVNNANHDQAARIRPLLNLLKMTGPTYVSPGRNLALNEASVACRSKYGKPLIVYDPMKPTGKYHFRLYMLCRFTTWIFLNFRLHCQSDVTERLAGVTTQAEAQALSDELALLDAMRLKGLYGRGTVRKSSAHFPRHVVIEKKDCTRGTSRQAVSADRNTVAASWYDSAIVTVISNADSSTLTSVARQVRSDKRTFSAPTCIKEYNTNMQGVDRLDQVRGRFSLADGHSFKKWYKKLGLALVDIARSTAYFTRKLALGQTNDRDSHRDFIAQLSSELLSGKWKEASSERRMFYTDVGSLDAPIEVDESMSPSSAVWIAGRRDIHECLGSPQKRCSAVSSKHLYPESNRKRRQCVVCRWEDRYATEVTDYCVLHTVRLCQHVFVTTKSYMCPKQTWTCWEKYHRFYLPRKLFSAKGKVRTSSDLYKLKHESMSQRNLTSEHEATAGNRLCVVRSINL